jgi:DNA-binding NarL/FixJ family response regulator
MIKVTIFEDNQSLRIGLYQLINGTEGYVCVGAFENCSQLLKNIRDTSPDIVLMDIEMPGVNGIEAVGILKKKFPEIRILMQTIFQDNDKIFQSILAGAEGYILKNTSPARMLEAIKEIYEGGAPMSPIVAKKVLKMVYNQPATPIKNDFQLTDREIGVLHCLVKGMSYKLIGDHLQISIDTVRAHIRNIYDKLHVNSKGEAIVKALKDNIV